MIQSSMLVLALLSAPPATPLADAVAAVDVSTFALPAPPTVRDRADVALGITSLSASSVAIAITAACVSDGTCREVNPVMRRWLGESRTSAIVGKAVIGGVTHYLVYRFLRKGKLRTLSLAGLAAVNLWDAGHDVRVMRSIERDRR